MYEYQKIEKRLKRHIKGRVREYFAITPPGFENICKNELKQAGFAEDTMRIVKGGVSFRGKFIDCLKANLYLKTATRILMRLTHFKATSFRKLEKETNKIPWELFLPQNFTPKIKVTSHHSRLYHKLAISEHMVKKILPKISSLSTGKIGGLKPTIFVRLIHDDVSISLDSTGNPLYKRGLKKTYAKAPIRESTAAALLSLMKVDLSVPFLDPMCGSGTFSLEAAMKTKQIPPGAMRKFAFMDWPVFQNQQWHFLKKCSLEKIKIFDTPIIYASDKSQSACKIFKKQIDNHNLSDIITVNQKNFFDIHPSDFPQGPGSIIINPPYGIRIGSKQSSKDLFGEICLHLKRFNKWTVGLIAPPTHDHNPMLRKLNQQMIRAGGLKLFFFFGKIP